MRAAIVLHLAKITNIGRNDYYAAFLGRWRSMSTWQKLNDGDISHRHTTDAHNMLNGNRRRASYFFFHIPFGRPPAPSAAE